MHHYRQEFLQYRAAKSAGAPSVPPPPVVPAQVPALGSQATNPVGVPPQLPTQQAVVPLPPNVAQNDQIAQMLNPQNPALQAALIQAVLQARGNGQGGVTIDDIANYLLSQGRQALSRHLP